MEEALVRRILPHSIEAEQSVIGSMLMDRMRSLLRLKFLQTMIFIRISTVLFLTLW